MTTPYILPQMLRDAPLGIDWTSVGSQITSPLDNLAALWDVCLVATGTADRTCHLPLRATAETETLEGPDYRLVLDQSTGLARAVMSHWPIIAALGAQYRPAASFPPTWTPIPSNQMEIREPFNQWLSGSALGVSGSDGSNEIAIAPGYITWAYGRNGCAVQIAYENGWPHAGIMPAGQTAVSTTQGEPTVVVASVSGLSVGQPVTDLLSALPYGTTIVSITAGAKTVKLSQTATATTANSLNVLYLGYPAGVSTLSVDDVTGFAGTRPRIYDGPWAEQLMVASVTPTTTFTLLPGVPATIGPGSVSLTSPTRFPHAAGQPAVSLLTTLPDAVRMACYFFAGAEALTRGSTAISAQAVPGSQSRTAGPTLNPNGLTRAAEHRLADFARVI